MSRAGPSDRIGGTGPLVRRAAWPVVGMIGLLALGIGSIFLADRKGSANLLATVYDVLGNGAGAEALRSGSGDQLLAKGLMAGLAMLVGVGGIWLVFAGLNAVIEHLPPKWRDRTTPWLFVVPAAALVGVFLVYPAASTVWMSLTEDGGAAANYGFVLRDPSMLATIRNNIIWLVVATGGSVILGLVIAGLVDRVRRESLAKTFIFLPLAISLVGASVIWLFVYAWRPPGQPQIGLLNAAWTAAGGQPVPWIQTQPINTYALITIMVWLQTGLPWWCCRPPSRACLSRSSRPRASTAHRSGRSSSG
jgi:hypothetical protein